jgi:hypothetical protein
MLQADVAAGDGGGHQVGARLDAIGQHLVVRAVQGLDAVDHDLVGASALDARAHRDQEIREIDDLRFAGGVLDDRLPVGQRGRHHQVLGPGDGRHVEDQVRRRAGARRARM